MYINPRRAPAAALPTRHPTQSRQPTSPSGLIRVRLATTVGNTRTNAFRCYSPGPNPGRVQSFALLLLGRAGGARAGGRRTGAERRPEQWPGAIALQPGSNRNRCTCITVPLAFRPTFRPPKQGSPCAATLLQR
jgi:hypothetical protein